MDFTKILRGTDKIGRLTIPKEIMEEVGLKPNQKILISSLPDGNILIEPVRNPRELFIKPIPTSIDTKRRNTANLPNPGGFAVNYSCPICGEKLCIFLGEHERFCHNCGQAIRWGGVITFINTALSDLLTDSKYTDEQKKKNEAYILETIHGMNQEQKGNEPIFISE